MPLVGEGSAYEGLAPVVGPRQPMPSGGLIQEDWRNLWKDIGGGFGLNYKVAADFDWLRNYSVTIFSTGLDGDSW